MRSIVVCGSFFLSVLWSCALMGDRMEEWKGLNRQELISTFGAPSEEVALPGGWHRLVYRKRITQHPTASQVYGISRTCEMTFETDENGIIQSASQKGC